MRVMEERRAPARFRVASLCGWGRAELWETFRAEFGP